jgi:hypothetical protein
MREMKVLHAIGRNGGTIAAALFFFRQIDFSDNGNAPVIGR